MVETNKGSWSGVRLTPPIEKKISRSSPIEISHPGDELPHHSNVQVHPGIFEISPNGRTRHELVDYTRANRNQREIFFTRSWWRFYLCTCSLSADSSEDESTELFVTDMDYKYQFPLIELRSIMPNSVWGGLSFFPPITITGDRRIIIKTDSANALGFIHGWWEDIGPL